MEFTTYRTYTHCSRKTAHADAEIQGLNNICVPFTKENFVSEMEQFMDEEFADMDKELYTPEEACELTMKDIKAIYDDAEV